MIKQQFNNGIHFQNINQRNISLDIKTNHQSPPATRIPYSSPSNKIAPQYLMHLIPQQTVSQQQPVKIMPSQSLPLQINSKQSQFNESINKQSVINRQNRSTTEAKQMIKVVANPNISSMVTCSSGGVSYFSQQKGSKDCLVRAHNMEYMQPKPPTIIKREEPIRRISQYKTNISQVSDGRSSKSVSQHNYHITIQTNSDNNNPAPTITISPGQNKNNENQIQRVNPSFIETKQAINRPILIRQRANTNQLSQYFGPQLQQSQFISQHQIRVPIINTPPTIINHHPPATFISHNPILIQQQQKQPGQISFKTIQHSQRPVKSEANIFKKQQICQQNRKQYYNEYYNNQVEQSPNKKKHLLNAYIEEQNFYTNSRQVINDIFEIETSKALLRMRLIQSKSREKSIKSLKKYYN